MVPRVSGFWFMFDYDYKKGPAHYDIDNYVPPLYIYNTARVHFPLAFKTRRLMNKLVY